MKRACVFPAERPWHRRELFTLGLQRVGFRVERMFNDPRPGDVVVLWNRNRYEEAWARRFEDCGATVLITENGYIGTDEKGGKLLALAKRLHNGAGEWRVGPPGRWTMPLHPWRSNGDFILVLPQRGIGSPGVSMPMGWAGKVMAHLKTMTQREIRLRPHPGAAKLDPYDALKGAWAAVTWGSGAGIKSLYAGVPVFYDFRSWIGAPASVHLKGADLERPFTGDRSPMFERLAWAQWSGSEIESGTAFAHLLEL